MAVIVCNHNVIEWYRLLKARLLTRAANIDKPLHYHSKSPRIIASVDHEIDRPHPIVFLPSKTDPFPSPHNRPTRARPAPIAAIGNTVAAAIPSEPVVEALVCAAEAAEEPVVRGLVDWAPEPELLLWSSLLLLEEPVASGSAKPLVKDAKSRP